MNWKVYVRRRSWPRPGSIRVLGGGSGENWKNIRQEGRYPKRAHPDLCLEQGCTNPGRQVVPATEFRTVKLEVKVKFTLEQATKAQRGSRGIVLLFP